MTDLNKIARSLDFGKYLSPLLLCDFYKTGHLYQYPQGTEIVYSNFTARAAKYFNYKGFGGKIVVFGIQAALGTLQGMFDNNFFNLPKEEAVAAFSRRITTSLGKGAVGTKHLEQLHDLGYLPLHVKCLPEGSLCPIGVPFMTLYNTVFEMYWFTNFVETILSALIWKPITVATIAYEFRRLCDKYAEKTGTPKEFVQWQCHDFSFRGMSGLDDAMRCGAAHLLSFTGTDTIPAIDFLEMVYGADAEKELIGGSVPATEHSVMCAGGMEDEMETFRRIIQDVYPDGIVSVVSDTWDYWDVITNKAAELKDVILSRGPDAFGNSKVVFRPDSGDPVRILAGYEEDELTWDGDQIVCAKTGKALTDAEVKGSVQVLYEQFGGELNSKGYIDLCPRVGLIYGDSITLERAEEIFERLERKGFSTSCVVFGIGSYTYQYITRDTFGMAMKATYAQVNGEGHSLLKNPKTDDGTKKSATGLLKVIKNDNGDFELIQGVSVAEETEGELKTVFYDSKASFTTLAEIRARLGVL